jgi:hypothetical protein
MKHSWTFQPAAAGRGHHPHDEAPLAGPIARKVLARMKRRMPASVAKIKPVLHSGVTPDELRKSVVAQKNLAGFEPAHAVYVYTQNQVSIMSEELTALQELAPLDDILAKAEDAYTPSAPPMSPLTTSYFTCWAFFDACAGPANETVGTTILAIGAALGLHTELLRLVRLMQESRMGLYIHQGTEGELAILEDFITGEVCRTLVPAGYSGEKGELWYVRVLPPPIQGSSLHVAFTTPYIVLQPGPREWLAYVSRTFSGTASIGDYIDHMKYGPTREYWNEYVFEAYVNYRTEAIFLAGLPDVAESRPHSKVSSLNGWTP